MGTQLAPEQVEIVARITNELGAANTPIYGYRSVSMNNADTVMQITVDIPEGLQEIGQDRVVKGMFLDQEKLAETVRNVNVNIKKRLAIGK